MPPRAPPNAQILVAQGGEIAHFSSQGAAREGGASISMVFMTQMSPSNVYPIRRG